MCDPQLLAALRFTAGLPREMLGELASISTLRTLPAESVIFREGAICPDLFLVQSGYVALDMRVPGRGAVLVFSVGEGELLGWSPLLGEGKMTATATVIEAAAVVVIPGADLRKLCESNHNIGYRVMQQVALALSQRLVATRLQLLDLFA
jgi:CRP-like cAMP-binding protein